MNKQAIARQLVAHALPVVPFHGWTHATFMEAARTANVTADYVSIAFPNGGMDAVEILVAEADEHMRLSLDPGFASLKMPQKITQLILDRLERFVPHREAMRRAVHLCMLPWNLSRTTAMGFRTVDAMWALAGACDHDFNWYTRRATLAYVYTATLTYWLSDEGEDMQRTAAYLQRRLDEVAKIGTLQRRRQQRRPHAQRGRLV